MEADHGQANVSRKSGDIETGKRALAPKRPYKTASSNALPGLDLREDGEGHSENCLRRREAIKRYAPRPNRHGGGNLIPVVSRGCGNCLVSARDHS